MLDWQILDENEWVDAQSATMQPAVEQRPYRRLFAWRVTGVLLVIISGAIYFMWQGAKADLRQSEAELLNTISLENAASGDSSRAVSIDEQTAPRWQKTILDQEQELALTIGGEAPSAKIEIENLEMQGDWAIAQVIIAQPDGAVAGFGYRQTRFYHHTAEGWLRTTPDASLWGPVQSIETEFFTFLFRAKDRRMVETVVAQVDELYASLRQDFGLPPANPNEQLVIEVAITAKPGNRTEFSFSRNKVTVSSPALLPVSTELAEADVMVQSIITALLTPLSDAAMRKTPAQWQWAHMVVALRRWQLWRHSEALTAWRHQTTAWLYRGSPASSTGSVMPLLEGFDRMCQKAQILEAAAPPGATSLSLWCRSADGVQLILHMAKPAVRLNDLIAPNASWQNQEHGIRSNQGYGLLGWYQYLPLETVIEYAVMTYGRDRLPALLEALGRYDTWQTLIPAVFDVSADEFERGWQAYLQTRYQSPNHPIIGFGD